MKRLLKYLLIFILAAVYQGSSGQSVSSVMEEDMADISFDISAYHTDFSPTESEFNLPRQTSFANSQRVQSTVRRTNSAHRSNIEFAKSGKVVNAGLRYFIQLQSIIIHSTLIEPSHRLLCLGKLII